jgi:alkanesulfonate monooxygenase SsuD/methylene tetrahydromethanopterin reductase-like flavin-dependent oxidoreductase (luciferase family)
VVSFGIKTTPADVGYEEIRRVWLDADEIPEIEHAWLYDHLLPLFSDPAGPAYEGWTLLAALAAQTQRLRLGLLVTNNRIRRPAVLAKIAATVDVISGGRLDFGIGVGGLPDSAPNAARVVPEYQAYGIPLGAWSDAVASFAEACTLIRRMWTEEVFDFDGTYHRLKGVRCNPRPVQRPHPPIVIGGSGKTTLRLVAEHADMWNAIGPPVNTVEHLRERSAVLDEQCEAIARDPASVVRSVQLLVSYDHPASTRATLSQLASAGFTHLVLTLRAPYPRDAARWATNELIIPTLDALGQR